MSKKHLVRSLSISAALFLIGAISWVWPEAVGLGVKSFTGTSAVQTNNYSKTTWVESVMVTHASAVVNTCAVYIVSADRTVSNLIGEADSLVFQTAVFQYFSPVVVYPNESILITCSASNTYSYRITTGRNDSERKR